MERRGGMIMLDTENNLIILKDGRKLGYAEYGDINGQAIFYFHGWPSSRLEARDLHEHALKTGVRIISVDRPGMGLSDYKEGRTVLEWPRDVVELADFLGLDKFGVLGASEGGPYVLACAHEISHRLTSVGLVSATSTVATAKAPNFMYGEELQMISIAKKFPGLAKLMIWWTFHKFESNTGSFNRFIKNLPESDKKVFLDNPEMKERFINMMTESHHFGIDGILLDVELEGRPLGFNLGEISMDVYLWQGEDDNRVYPAMGYYLAREIPHCHPVFLPHEGHISMLSNHADEILNTMIN
jgi:pimeloyl-ACP methyl ester carboxylesterase